MILGSLVGMPLPRLSPDLGLTFGWNEYEHQRDQTSSSCDVEPIGSGLALLAFDLSVPPATDDGLLAEALRSLLADPHWGVNSLLGSRSRRSRPNGDRRMILDFKCTSKPPIPRTCFNRVGGPLSNPR